MQIKTHLISTKSTDSRPTRSIMLWQLVTVLRESIDPQSYDSMIGYDNIKTSLKELILQTL